VFVNYGYAGTKNTTKLAEQKILVSGMEIQNAQQNFIYKMEWDGDDRLNRKKIKIYDANLRRKDESNLLIY